MSFRIFSLQLMGKIKPVEKIELQRKNLLDDYQEFTHVENSDELREFLELEKHIQSADFNAVKKEIQQLRFKGSKEEGVLKEFEQLKKSSGIKKYFKLEGSAELKRFETIKESDKLTEYKQLKEFVENGEFRTVKEEMLRSVFKGSEEQQREKEYNSLNKKPGIKVYYELFESELLKKHEAVSHSEKLKKYFELRDLSVKDKDKKREFGELKNDSEIKSYLKFDRSKKLKLYKETADSYHLKKHQELKTEVESDDFRKRVEYLKDKKKFEKTEAFKKKTRLKELSASDDIKFYLKFEKSSLLDNYLKVSESAELKRYVELKDLVSSEDFLKRKAYLDDPKKWEKSEEYATEQNYFEMKKRPHLVKYFKYKGTDAFDFFRQWTVSFEDDFNSKKLDTEKWSTVSAEAEKTLGQNYALPGDLHLFTDGKNITTEGKLVIETRKENTNGMVWKMPAGFVPAGFEYTSGLVSTSKSFWQQDGIFEAKIKFNPVKETVSSLALKGEKASPGVYLLEMGLKNRLGIATVNATGKLEMNGLDVSNLKKGAWYIFTCEKSGSAFTWKINDVEVLKLEDHSVGFPLQIFLSTIVTDQITPSKLPVRFQTEWVRCYKKNA
ncbi:hypothetical protein SAMN05444274_101308 [Mariniphaga anaerophila]|uniref:GH16 domain-containing protein n=1 Tax=Mariniphaga anaerophila TaxID=1484053 RepID=A0A1M4TAV8_9BACT|nr:hypothetical protein [Mariniphaga anaerophila]SHE41565.1 hypothetical protein SAMN05444274_101308 [Mariniphaga anaerophila]